MGRLWTAALVGAKLNGVKVGIGVVSGFAVLSTLAAELGRNGVSVGTRVALSWLGLEFTATSNGVRVGTISTMAVSVAADV